MIKLRRGLDPADIVHVTTRAVVEIPLFRDDRDREYWERLLEVVAARFGWVVSSYILMTTHYHIVLEAPGGTLSAGMQMLNGGYAREYNRRYGRIGHALMGRFHAVRVTVEAHFLEACRYVVLNATRAGICAHPRHMRFCSYLASIGRTKPPPFLKLDRLLGCFGTNLAAAQKRFAAFIEEGLLMPRP
jgi:REP element-mobilizing transposase RayT